MLRGHRIRYRLEDRGQALSQALRQGLGRVSISECRDCEAPDGIYRFVNSHLPGPWQQRRSEILVFLGQLSDMKPERICEIGTAEGGTTVALARSAPTVKLMIGVDLYVRRKYTLRALAGHSRKSMILIDGDSHSPSLVRRVQEVLANEQLDVLFIDGDHSLEGVRDDFATYRCFVREGGLIAFHDIVPDSYLRNGTAGPMSSGDVPRFWAVIKDMYQHQEIVDDPNQDGFGIGVLQYSSQVDVDAALRASPLTARRRA